MSTIADRIRAAAEKTRTSSVTARPAMIKLVLDTIANDLVDAAETKGVTSINYKYIASRGVENFPRALKDNAKLTFKQQKAEEGVEIGSDKLTAIDLYLKDADDHFMADLQLLAVNEGLYLRHEHVGGKNGGLFLVVDVVETEGNLMPSEERKKITEEMLRNREPKPKAKKTSSDVYTEDVFDDGNVPDLETLYLRGELTVEQAEEMKAEEESGGFTPMAQIGLAAIHSYVNPTAQVKDFLSSPERDAFNPGK